MQIDVEDWFCDLETNEWDKKESRVVKSTERILELLKKTNNKATFFILGYVAEKFPALVKKIEKEGHEIASHGYCHKRIDEQTPEEFEDDLKKSIKILEKITKDKIKGYRAPQFTITKKTLWALDVIKKLGLKYDSSIFPVKTPLYGIEDAPLYPYKTKTRNGELLEIPLSIYKMPILKKNIPIAGGFYLRFFPSFFISHAVKKINNSGNSAVLYIHPWDLDFGKPKLKPKSLRKYYSFDASDKSLKWFHYYGLKKAERKFERLLNGFKFTSTEDWINKNSNGTGKRS